MMFWVGTRHTGKAQVASCNSSRLLSGIKAMSKFKNRQKTTLPPSNELANQASVLRSEVSKFLASIRAA